MQIINLTAASLLKQAIYPACRYYGFMSEFAIRLKELRLENRFSQDEFAKKLNVKQNTVSSWERGVHEPPIDIIKQIVLLLKCNADYLLGITNTP